MAFNNGFPMGYPQMVMPQQVAPAQEQQVYYNQQPPTRENSNQGIIWVQGDAGAKSYPVAPNQSVMLMDSETSCFYIKSADASGMPLPLRTFDYVERVQTAQAPATQQQEKEVDLSAYMTKDEFEDRLMSLSEQVNNLSRQFTELSNDRRKK